MHFFNASRGMPRFVPISVLCLLFLLASLPGTALTPVLVAKAEKWGKLFVESDPPGANVRFLRIKYRYKPGIILAEGRYIIEVSKPGFEPVLKEIDVFAGQDNVVRVSLREPGVSGAEPTSGQSPAPPPRQEVEPEKDLRIPLSNTMQPQEKPQAEPQEKAEEKTKRFDRGFGPMPRPMRKKSKIEEQSSTPLPQEDLAEPPPPPEEATPLRTDLKSYQGQLPPPAEQPEQGGLQAVPVEPAQKQEQSAPTEIPKTLDAENPPSPEELMQVSNHLAQAGDLPNAIQGFTLVLQQQPKNVNAYVGRGFAYYKLGNYAFAIEDLTSALELDEAHLSAWFHRGNAYLMSGDFDLALQDYEKALSISDTVPDVFNARGTVLYNTNDLEGAIRDFESAIALDPAYTDAYFNRGSAYLKLGKAQLALDDFNKVLTLDPEDSLARKKKKQAEKILHP